MIKIKCGSCGYTGDIEDFDSVFCNGPEDYQCPKCSAFYKRVVSDLERDFYSSIELFRLIENKLALYEGTLASDSYLDKFFRYGKRLIRVRKNLRNKTLQHTMLNFPESNSIAIQISTSEN